MNEENKATPQSSRILGGDMHAKNLLSIARVSHELRSPLANILGYAQLLALRHESDPESSAFIGTIIRNSKRLIRITEDILDYSKVEMGTLSIKKSRVNIVDEIHSVLEFFGHYIEEKKLEISVELEPGLPTEVFVDPTRLQQVLVSLIGNAIKFTAQGQVSISVNSEDSVFISFDIRDAGIGISPENQLILFQPFQQADEKIGLQYGGCGLGLALSRSIARLLGGDVILVKSSLGHGSHFRFKIPLSICDQESS